MLVVEVILTCCCVLLSLFGIAVAILAMIAAFDKRHYYRGLFHK